MTTATYIEKDQNWMDGNTIYWFDVDGEEFGIVEGQDEGIVDCDGAPITNEHDRIAVERHCIVTDEMRAE